MRSSNGIDDDLLEVIGLIYEAALDPELWPATLERLARLFGAQAGILLPWGIDVPPWALTRVGGDIGDMLDEYARGWHAFDVRYHSNTNRCDGDVFVDHDALSKRDMDRHPLYADYLARYGLRYYMGTDLLKDGASFTWAFSLQRTARQGHFEPEEIARFRFVLTHVRRALKLQARMAALEQGRAALAAAVDAFAFGVVLVDVRGRVLVLNQAAAALANAGDGFTVRDGELRTALPRDTAALRRLIDEAIATAQEAGRGSGGGAMPLPRPEPRRPLSALVVPVPRRRDVLGSDTGADRPAAVIAITDPEAAPEPPEGVLKQLYGLTLAESALARALSAGRSPQEYADGAAITAETARWHLKRIFAKTGTTRQAEFVSLILKATPPL